MNMNLYGHSDNWLMVDCGATFKAPLDAGDDHKENVKTCDVVSADPSFIENRQEQLCGIIITHAHEDHIGALPALWARFKCPVYTTAFTAEVLRRKLYYTAIAEEVTIVVVEPNSQLDIGPFTVSWLPITHSLPDAQALLIQTPVASVFHTADWKIDFNPITDQPFQPALFKALSKYRPTAMVCDSTNALKAGHSVSEGDCELGLLRTIKAQTGRVIVTCFGSNVARLISLARVAEETGRYMTLLGRSLDNMYGIARATGYWPDELKIAHRRHIGYLPKHEVLIVATGSQGEARAALGKLANGTHRDCELEAGDTVIFSAISIPGNEVAIEKLVSGLREKGVTVIQSSDSPHTIHASGHPCQGDLHDMYSWVNPHIAVPVHGEKEHMIANAKVAAEANIAKQLVGKNGDLFQLAPQVVVINHAVQVGRIDITENKAKN
ncbi:ribonuclease J [Glaciecola sp. MH2013]|uniref:ribonuclease J n=1 Tax=Glaciecola sp. MH2013 TaxID=2785524 RepID=UPI00189FFB63|nr:ribonuclease J [Glaciecola sp. MH2013]MBF7073044.1 ribonuclease J [Glaciecola sp. MH2013]